MKTPSSAPAVATVSDLLTVEDIAARYGLTVDQVVRKCNPKADNPWPHIRPSRLASSWRFSPEDVREIEAQSSSRSIDTWGRTR